MIYLNKHKILILILLSLIVIQLTACGGTSDYTKAICSFLSKQDDIRWDWTEVKVDTSTVSKVFASGDVICYKDSEDAYHLVHIKRTDDTDWDIGLFGIQKNRTRYFDVFVYKNVTIGNSDSGLYIKGISEDNAKTYQIKNEQKILFGIESNNWYNSK